MAACKCRFCQGKLTTSVAYKAEINKKSAYFCNQNHHERYLQEEEKKQNVRAKERELQDKFYVLMCEILGVEGITNTALYKEKKEINQVFSDEVIVMFLEENKDWMRQSVGRLNGGMYGKIRYVSVILRNRLGDYKPKVEVREEVKAQQEIQTIAETREDVGLRINKKKKAIRRKGFAEMED